MEPQQKLYSILQSDSRYPLPAYAAIHKGLDYTIRLKRRKGHVDGQELAVGMAGYLRDEFGPFARMVLNGWNIQSTLDFGQIVFNLVDAELMRKQETDSIDAFRDVYDFGEVFESDIDWLEPIRQELGLASPKLDAPL